MSNFFNLEKPHNLIIAVLIIAVVVLGYMQLGGNLLVSGVLSQEEAAKAALSFINENMIQSGAPAADMSGEIEEDAGLYKFNIKVDGQEFPVYVSKDGNLLFPQAPINIKEVKEQKAAATTSDDGQNGTTSGGVTIGGFNVSDEEVCLENGEPVVYFFGSETCPHCRWEHPVVQKIMEQFEGLVVFYDNYDNGKDMDIFSKYSQGGIPTLVLGCKYYRVGSGERQGEEQNTKNITALLCKLTGNQPSGVCSGVADLVDQI